MGGNPRPKIPAEPVEKMVVFVLFTAANVWSGMDRLPIPTVSWPIGPDAYVPVWESPYSKRTLRSVLFSDSIE